MKNGSIDAPYGPARELIWSSSTRLDFANFARMVWRRKWIIAGFACLVTVLAALFVLQVRPIYVASAKIVLESTQDNVVDIESVVSGIPAEHATILSEMEIIRSGALVRRVVDKLGLVNDPEFNGSLVEPTRFQTLLNLETYVPRATLVALGLRQAEVRLSQVEQAERTLARVVEAVQGRLNVGVIRGSLVIVLKFESHNPNKAALIANTIANIYIVDQLEAKYEATQRATAWLSERIEELRQRVIGSENQVVAFREEVAGQIGQGSKLTEQQVSEVSTQLINAQAETAAVTARLQQVLQIQNNNGDLDALTDVFNAPMVQRLREQESTITRKISELESRYGEKHPKMVDARGELFEVRAAIKREVQKVLQGLRNEVQIARAREASLRRSLRGLESQGVGQGRAEVRLRELQREAEANKLLYENFLNRFKETSEQEDLQRADARVISRAEPPLRASYPKKTLTVLLAAIAALFTGILIAIILEYLDNTFRSSEDLEQRTGIPVIGVVPQVAKWQNRRAISRYVRDHPSSGVSEAIRNLRTSLILGSSESAPQVVGFTSSAPSEGKSTLALWLAQIAAMSEQRVLLIDCDLRRPSIMKYLDVSATNTLIDVLSGNAEINDALVFDQVANIYVLPVTEVRAGGFDALSSDRLQKLIESLRQSFDMIVLDLPPVLAVADARSIGKLVDGLVFAVKWGGVSRDIAQLGIKTVRASGLNLSGLVLTQVNLRKHKRYGYDDYGSYYGRYSAYYSKA